MRVNLFFGFLGSGKTTLVKRLIQERGTDTRTAVIVNEFGDVGIDGEILKGNNVDMIELNSGCMCCTLKGSLILAIEELRQKMGAERVIVEATGVAQPGDMVETLTDPAINAQYEIGPLVTVVDAAKFSRLEAVLGEFYIEQIEHADIVVLNKIDLASHDQLESVRKEVEEINPRAIVLFAMQGDVDARLLLNGDMSGLLGLAAVHRAACGMPDHVHDSGCDHHHTAGDEQTGDGDAGSHHGLAHDVESFVLDATGGASRAGIEEFFNTLPECVWRVKGFMQIDGEPCLLQYTMGQFEIAATGTQSHPNMVFIGRSMDRALIESRFVFPGCEAARSVAGG